MTKKAAATDEQARRDIARLMTAPEFAAARVMQAAEGTGGFGGQLDTPELVNSLRALTDKTKSGDLGQAEAMLFNQAMALQSLFSRLVERGMQAELLPLFESFMRLALRAQAQSTRTLEVLATLKNPPVVFAKQANIAQPTSFGGCTLQPPKPVVFAKQANIAQQQQLNNGPAVPATRARNTGC